MRQFRRPRKETLIKQIHKLQLPIKNPESLSVPKLSALIDLYVKTYLESWFLRRIRVDLIPLFCIREPGRNKTHLPESKLEFDFSWLSLKIAIEIQGGIDSAGRKSGHLSRAGIRRDMRKVCLCSLHGWMLFQLAPEHVTEDVQWKTYTLPMLKTAIERRKYGQ